MLLYKVGALGFQLAESLFRLTNIRKFSVGRAIIANLNLAGSAALKVILSGSAITVHGQKMYVADEGRAGFGLMLNMVTGRYELAVTQLFKHAIRPGCVVVDIGAHVGYYTLLASRLVGPQGRVYAFEADPTNYRLLQRNLDLNGTDNVIAVPMAVADRTGSIDFFRDKRGSDRHSICRSSTITDESIKVEATSLDSFMQQQGCEQIDFLKMDIEGAEPMAVEGMTALLQRGLVSRMVIEFGPLGLKANGWSPEEFLRKLVAHGFDISPIEGEAYLITPEHLSTFIRGVEKKGGTNLLCEKRQPNDSRIRSTAAHTRKSSEAENCT